MSRSSLSPNTDHFPLGYDRQPRPLSMTLRSALGKMGFLNISLDNASAQPQPDIAPLAYSHDGLKKYVIDAGIDPDDTHMAIPIEKLPKLAIPEELTIVKINPDDTRAAHDYHMVAAQSLHPDHCPIPYTDPRVNESNKTYYIGYVTLDKKQIAATTLETIDHGSQGAIALIDNVSTLEPFRGHNYAGVLISNALSDSQYDIALLSSTPDARAFYERLGFIPIE